MPTFKNNHIAESQSLLRLCHEVESLDLGDRREKIIKLFSRLQSGIAKPLDGNFFVVNASLKKFLIQQRNALRVKGYQEQELRPLTDSINVLNGYAKIEKINNYKYFIYHMALYAISALSLAALFCFYGN